MSKSTSIKREGPQQAKPRFPLIKALAKKAREFAYKPAGAYGVMSGHSRGQKNYKS